MKILVIPDVHLKAWMFEAAERLLRDGIADRAVCMMDIADDWDHQFDLDLYRSAYDAAIRFAKTFSDTLWTYGNHDISYVYEEPESGYSGMAASLVRQKLKELRQALPDESQLAFAHRVDKVLFVHGGLTERFAEDYVPWAADLDTVVSAINGMSSTELWQDTSPLWHRPQYSYMRTYALGGVIQVVGHTPVTKIERVGNVISCDVFSTFRNGRPIGTQEFLLIDTETGEFCGVK